MNTRSFHDSVILVTKLTQTQHEISCVLLNFFRLLSPGPCVRSGIKKFHNFLVGVDMDFVKQFDLLKKSVSKGGKTENNHKKTKFQFLYLNYEFPGKGGKDLEFGWLAQANHENGTKSAECDPDYGWLEGAEGSNKCYMLIKGFDSS
mgnify:CR=1 FL=1